MCQLKIFFCKKWKTYRPKNGIITDTALDIFVQFLREIPINSEDWFISKVQEEWLGGMNIMEYDYKDGRIIISNELDSYDEGGPFISIQKEKLYGLIKKWAQFSREQVPTITLIRDGDNYDIKANE